MFKLIHKKILMYMSDNVNNLLKEGILSREIDELINKADNDTKNVFKKMINDKEKSNLMNAFFAVHLVRKYREVFDIILYEVGVGIWEDALHLETERVNKNYRKGFSAGADRYLELLHSDVKMLLTFDSIPSKKEAEERAHDLALLAAFFEVGGDDMR